MDVDAMRRELESRPYLQTLKYTIESRTRTKKRVAKARNSATRESDGEAFWRRDHAVSHYLSPVQDAALSTFVVECVRLRETKLRALLVKKSSVASAAKRNQLLITNMFKSKTQQQQQHQFSTDVPGPREATEERMNNVRDVKEDKEFEAKLIDKLATLFFRFQLGETRGVDVTVNSGNVTLKRVGRGEGESLLAVYDEEHGCAINDEDELLDAAAGDDDDDDDDLLEKAKAVGKKLVSTLKVFVSTHRTHMRYCSVGVATLELIIEFATIFRREPNHDKRDVATHGLFDTKIRTKTVKCCTEDDHGVTYYADNMKTDKMLEEYLVRRTLEFFFDPSIHIDWKYHGLSTFHTASYLDAFRASAQKMIAARDRLDLFGRDTPARKYVERLLTSHPDLNPYCILPIASRAFAFLRLGNRTPPHEITHAIWDYAPIPLASVNTGVSLDFSSSAVDSCLTIDRTKSSSVFSPCELGRRVAGMQYSKLASLLTGRTDAHITETKRMNLNNWTQVNGKMLMLAQVPMTVHLCCDFPDSIGKEAFKLKHIHAICNTISASSVRRCINVRVNKASMASLASRVVKTIKFSGGPSTSKVLDCGGINQFFDEDSEDVNSPGLDGLACWATNTRRVMVAETCDGSLPVDNHTGLTPNWGGARFTQISAVVRRVLGDTFTTKADF